MRVHMVRNFDIATHVTLININFDEDASSLRGSEDEKAQPGEFDALLGDRVAKLALLRERLSTLEDALTDESGIHDRPSKLVLADNSIPADASPSYGVLPATSVTTGAGPELFCGHLLAAEVSCALVQFDRRN